MTKMPEFVERLYVGDCLMACLLDQGGVSYYAKVDGFSWDEDLNSRSINVSFYDDHAVYHRSLFFSEYGKVWLAYAVSY